MAVLALALYGIWIGLAFGARVLVQLRRTGDTGIRGMTASGAADHCARGFFLVALVAGGLAPVAELRGLDPIAGLGATFVRATGASIAALGILATLGAQLAMGDAWRIGVDPDERTRLVTSGPFRLARNPIFTAMILTGFGLALLVPNWLGVAGLATLVLAIQLQARVVEEPCLLGVHGDAYARYAARVGRFLPGIGRAPTRAPEQVP